MITEASLLQFFGRLHPLLLHLPIGLWLGLVALEFGGAMFRRAPSRGVSAALAWIAALGAAVTAAAGWFLAKEGGYAERTLELHRWLGVAAAGCCLLAASLAGLRARGPFRLLLLTGLLALGAAGHLGSTMTHGEDWLLEPFEPHAAAPTPAATADAPTDAPTDAGDVDPAPSAASTFAATVLPILTERCGKCHGATKQKGELALHTAAAIRAGGENGAVLVPGDAEASDLVRRLSLPLDDDDHMPPEGKPQATAGEVAILRAWIAAGAPFEGAFDPAAAPAPRTPPAASPNGPSPKQPAALQPTPAQAVEPDPRDPHPTPPGRGPEERPPATLPQSTTPAPAPHQAPADDDPAPAAPVTPAPTPGPGPGPSPNDGTDGGSEVAVAALRAALVHVEPSIAGSDGLWVDFAPVAPAFDPAQLAPLLAPITARVERLGLSRLRIGDDQLPLLASMRRLTDLDLRATAVSGSGLAALGALPLRRLVLAETAVGDDAVPTLLALPDLQQVAVWNAGLSPAGLACLRGRDGLRVDDGLPLADAAVEVEPPPEFHRPETPPAAPAAPATTAALQPVNSICPISGKPVDERYAIVHEQRVVGFCCPKCPAAFWQDPAAHPVAAR